MLEAEKTSVGGVSYVEGSRGILPQKFLKTRAPKIPFSAIWTLNLDFKNELNFAYFLGAVYMSPVCGASPFKRGVRFHYNFLSKIILLYMQNGLARLGGIPLDSNGAPGQPGLNLSM